MRHYSGILLLLFLLLSLASCSSSRRAATPTDKPDSTATKENGDKKGIKAFSEVIKDDFKKDEGLFTVYQDGEKFYYEIPDDRLNDEFLLVTRIARTANEIGYGGEEANEMVVRWERRNEKVFLRIVSYANVADPEDPIYRAIENSNLEPILQAFDIEAYNADSTGVVIEATSLYTTDVAPLGLQKSRRTAYSVRRLDTDRTYISYIHSYPQNIEVRHVLTYEATAPPSNSNTNAITLEMNQSMIELPTDPWKPRLCDDRVGLISVQMTEYSSDQQKAEPICYISRWRLEPSDKVAYARGELVEPIKPIVYYIDPATPQKWRPFLKQGVEDWNRAFEAAGFKNAIRAMDPPSPEEDPEFSPEDVRYSVIRYFASPTQNAYGPHISDPRTGEILESDIGWYHNVMNLVRNWYLVQTSAVNPKARAVEFEDDVMGRLIRFVSAHEVGHTLGFQHNMGSSSGYTVAQLRDPQFTLSHGTAPSIMDYARFNYVAQPGDGVTRFMADIGEYDLWATKWAYSWLGEETTPKEDHETLNAWVVERAGNPLYWFGSGRLDPRVQSEDLTDDAMEASNLGIENLKRILDNLIVWTDEYAKDYDDLEELYGRVVGQWRLYIGHVTAQVGGVYEDLKTNDQEGDVYQPTPKSRQEAAMEWLDKQVFKTPEWLVRDDILRRIEAVGMLDRIRTAQTSAVTGLLNTQRLARLLEAELVFGVDSYTLSELFADLRGSLFSELPAGAAISGYRRQLQRVYVERLQCFMEEDSAGNPSLVSCGNSTMDVSLSDVRAYVRGELETLKAQADRAAGRARDNVTRLHLRELSARIADILDTVSD